MDRNKRIYKYQLLGVPKQIIIQNNYYSFKKELNNSFISYRCVHRNCNASIKISLENAKKIFNKDTEDKQESKIDYTLVGNHSNHPKEKKIEENLGGVKNENEIKELAKILIRNNLDLPLSFHIKNLDSNKIKLPKVKIKNILQALREENFPKDSVK